MAKKKNSISEDQKEKGGENLEEEEEVSSDGSVDPDAIEGLFDESYDGDTYNDVDMF